MTHGAITELERRSQLGVGSATQAVSEQAVGGAPVGDLDVGGVAVGLGPAIAVLHVQVLGSPIAAAANAVEVLPE
eukprot:13384003-Alexandrium_andersonii.AAC.1